MQAGAPGSLNEPGRGWASWLLLAAILAAWMGSRWSAAAQAGVPFPEGYRRWTHVRSVLVGPQSPFFSTSGGMHHIYANEKAMERYAAHNFPDGAVLVFDLFEVKEKDGITSASARQRIDVMLKDSRRFAGSGGWGFERFMGDGQEPALDEQHRDSCFTCHEQVKQKDFVFSDYRK